MNWILCGLVALLLVAIAALANHSFGWWNPPKRLDAWLDTVRARLGHIALVLSLLLAAVGIVSALGNGRFWHLSWAAVSATFIPLVMLVVWVIVCLDQMMREQGWH